MQDATRSYDPLALTLKDAVPQSLDDQITALIKRITEIPIGGLGDLFNTAIDLRCKLLTLHAEVAALRDKVDYQLPW